MGMSIKQIQEAMKVLRRKTADTDREIYTLRIALGRIRQRAKLLIDQNPNFKDIVKIVNDVL